MININGLCFVNIQIYYAFLTAGHKIKPAYDFDYVALDLLTIYPEDSGIYTCNARNAYGEAQTSATIRVQGMLVSILYFKVGYNNVATSG